MRFPDRVAFVTGASRGVGKALALRLAAEGCDVVVAAKTVAPNPNLPGTIQETAQEIEALGRRALAVEMDVRDDAAVERAARMALEKFGHVDFLVNNAGALYWRSVAETEMKRFDLVMGVNARGAFACTRHLLPSMLARGFGHILMLSPPVEPAAGAGKVAYALSKFGMTLVAQGVAEEVRGRGVAANALWPATIKWGLGDRSMWRTPEIVADAMVAIFARPPDAFTGQAVIDEDLLRAEGVTDFTRYRCDPDREPPRVGFDFKLRAG
jgi:citronellol/citronellal dehydrogenase